MRGLVVLCFAFAAAASGCVELADANDPDVEAAALQAADALANYTAKTGHLAGVVYGADGEALDGAQVTVGDALVLGTDLGGRFAAVDLAPGSYAVAVLAEGHAPWSSSYAVEAGRYTRPEIHLDALAPEPYLVQHTMDGYAQFTTLFSGPCACAWSADLDPEESEGLMGVVLEARRTGGMGGVLSYHEFDYMVSAWTDREETGYESGYDTDPLRVELDPALFSGAEAFELYVQPHNLLFEAQTRFEVALTFFYHAPAPEDYTGLA